MNYWRLKKMIRLKRNLLVSSKNSWRYYIPNELIADRNNDSVYACYEFKNNSYFVTFLDETKLNDEIKKNNIFFLKSKAYIIKAVGKNQTDRFVATLLKSLSDSMNLSKNTKYSIFFSFYDATRGLPKFRITVEPRV